MTADPAPLPEPGLARRLAGPVAVAAVTAAVVTYVGAVDPNEAGHYPTCPFLWLTGWYCPGCGSLRAVHALAHLDVGVALARNPLTVLAVPLLLWTFLRWTTHRARGTRRTWAAPAWVVWALLAVILGFWVLRNLPGFGWLAP